MIINNILNKISKTCMLVIIITGSVIIIGSIYRLDKARLIKGEGNNAISHTNEVIILDKSNKYDVRKYCNVYCNNYEDKDACSEYCVNSVQKILMTHKNTLTCPSGMVYVHSGKYIRNRDQNIDDDYSPRFKSKEIKITKGYCIDKFETTQLEYNFIMNNNPSFYQYCGYSCPVDNVTWLDAISYCNNINKRLPSEAEWEYAAYGGQTIEYAHSKIKMNKYAWYLDNSQVNYFRNCKEDEKHIDNHTIVRKFESFYNGHDYTCNQGGPHKVGEKLPNKYNIHDMIGNVAEWVVDYYDFNWHYRMPTADPVNLKTNDADSNMRVVKGGNWDTSIKGLFITDRYPWYYNKGNTGIGFRCAKDAD